VNKVGPDTLLTVFSSSKSLTAIAMAMALDRGYLRSYDQTIAEIWPEFAGEGKVQHCLN
jgi:CubicO group peptidase (beta-lactamase class C family)